MHDASPLIRRTRWAWTLSTFFGAGYLKPGPGTYGSIFAVLLWYLAADVVSPTRTTLAIATAIAALLITAIGIPASTITARESSRLGLSGEDPGFVVIDEVAGVWITLLGAVFHPDWQHIVIAFLLFRVFDIFKPFPIREIEKLPEGWGIVFDDVAAGLYARAVLVLLNRWI